jgi:plasmid replication initiation protein
MKEDEMSNAIAEMQASNDYLILDNAFSSPKFVKQLSKTEYKLAKTDTYTLKLFAELLSRLNYELLENTTEINQIKIEINIKDFLNDIGIGHNMGYNYVIEASRYLKTLMLQWKEKDGIIKESVFVSYSEHNPKTGKVNLFIPQQFAKRVLDVGMKENFSFLKQNLFKLENNQAIKLYQFFKSWQNKGVYQTDLERFKEQFGYNTSGYKLYSKFKERVLEPATKEINNKTDIIVSYQTTGDNLESLRPRVKGLIFTIKAKGKDTKQLPNGERHQTPQPKDDKTHISNLITQAVPKQEPKPQTPKQQATAGEPSQEQILELTKLVKLNPQEVNVIQGLYKTNIRVWEAIKAYLTAPNKATIQKPYAYIIDHKSINTLGVGLWQVEKEKAEKRETERIEKEKQALIEKIQKEYKDRKKTQFLKFYENTTDEQKAELFEYIKETKTIKTSFGDKNYCINNNQLNKDGQATAGEYLAEQRGAGKEVRQNKYRNEVFEKYSYQIAYDEHDQVIILGLFENVEQPKPQEQEPQRTAEQLAENKKKYQAIKRQPKTAAPKTTEPKATEKPLQKVVIKEEPQQEYKEVKKGFFSSIGDLIQSKLKK